MASTVHDWGIWAFTLVTACATSAAVFYAWRLNRPEFEIDAQRTELGTTETVVFNCQLDASNPTAHSIIVEGVRAISPRSLTVAEAAYTQNRFGDMLPFPDTFSGRLVSMGNQVSPRSAEKFRFYASVPEGRSLKRLKFGVMWRKKSRSIHQRRWIRYARIMD